MSGWNIRFSKDHLARAKEKGRHSVAIGYDGAGRAEAFMWLTPDDTTFLWLFAHEINQGKTPAEAFAVVEQKFAEHAAKQAAKLAAANTIP
jgi:hypothetical protein